jgi:hypothetical protein
LLLTLIIIGAFFSTNLVFGQTNIGSTDLTNANLAITNALQAVSKVQKLGGNVSSFLDKLNTAEQLVASSENSLRSNSSKNVIADLTTANSIANQVNLEANELYSLELQQSALNRILEVVFSLLGIGIFLIVLWFVWYRVKRRYKDKLLDMHPVYP